MAGGGTYSMDDTKGEEDYFILKFKLTRQQMKTAFNINKDCQ
jgi:hypothetical protein